MPLFEYIATDPQGKTVRGSTRGATLAEAADGLTSRGLQVETVRAIGTDPSAPPKPTEDRPVELPIGKDLGYLSEPRSWFATSLVGPVVGKVPLTDLMFFFRQLSTMLNAGVGMVAALDSLERQTRFPKLKKVIRELREFALGGKPLSLGMERYPEVFSKLMISVVRAGEQGGFLEGSLRQLANYLEKEIELRNLIRRVTAYPKILTFFAILVVLGANTIMNMITGGSIFSSPVLTVGFWIVVIPILVGIFLFLRIGLQNRQVRYAWDLVLLCIPFIGGTVRRLAMAKFGSAFGLLYSSGVPIHMVVPLAADACGNEFIKRQVAPAQISLMEGRGVARSFEETKVFPPTVIEMVRTGEQTGSMDQMLLKVSEYYEDEGRTRSVQAGHALGVFVFLVVALWIGSMILSAYSGYIGNIQQQME